MARVFLVRTQGSGRLGRAVRFAAGIAALIALDQMDGGDLKPDEVIPLLNDADERRRAVANWILGHHPDWGATLAGYFRERLARKDLTESDRAELPPQLARHHDACRGTPRCTRSTAIGPPRICRS